MNYGKNKFETKGSQKCCMAMIYLYTQNKFRNKFKGFGTLGELTVVLSWYQ